MKYPAETDSQILTVIYDGSCNVCSRIAGLFKKWDRDGVLWVVPSQEPGVRDRFPWIPADAYDSSLQVVTQAGTTLQGARGVEEVLSVLPKGRWLAWIFRIPFIRPMAEKFYSWFARNRYRLGCGDHCSLQTRETPPRGGKPKQ